MYETSLGQPTSCPAKGTSQSLSGDLSMNRKRTMRALVALAIGLSALGMFAQFNRGPVDPNAKNYPGGDRIWLTPLHSVVLPADMTA
jgi:hypothetical protein